MSRPAIPASTYLLTWAALLSLTLLTSVLGLIDMGQFSVIVAVLIAVLKASLIVAFFMHALYESKLVWTILGGGIVWFLILFSLTLGDFITRGWLPVPGK